MMACGVLIVSCKSVAYPGHIVSKTLNIDNTER